MSYPTLEQYNEAFQHPHLSLVDPELKRGSIKTTGLGLPLALCGGFALTYTLNSGASKYAIRCFHKKSNELESRYSSISTRLKNLRSKYFVEFEFQKHGIKVAGNSYPVVKMAWATGTTLGEFLEQRYRSKADLESLNASLYELAIYLESQKMAHGDIQPGNVMVADSGKTIQLIDYDGIYVEDLKSFGSAELGHRNFQHPMRASSSWDFSLDRFSFISLHLSIRILIEHPEFWVKTQSDGDSVLFKANDFADPASSSIFLELFKHPKFSEDAKNFASICKSSFEKLPTLIDFVAKKNIPQVVFSLTSTSKSVPAQYLSAYPVLDATNYMSCMRYVGDKVELIGRIVEIKTDKTKHGKAYAFINFGPWQGNIVKISVWSEGLASITNKPNQSWVGQWISVTGLMEPPFVNKRYKYSHLAISITQPNQLHFISAAEANLRLNGSSTRLVNSSPQSNNSKILDGIRSGVSTGATSQVQLKQPPKTTTNTAILQAMKANQQPPLKKPNMNNAVKPVCSPKNNKTSGNSNCFIATSIYGIDGVQTNMLRNWRDEVLLRHIFGRNFVAIYYFISPKIVKVIESQPKLKKPIQKLLDRFVTYISS